MEGKEGDNLTVLRSWGILPARALQCATSFDGRNPFTAKAFSTDSLTVDELQSDISLQV